LFPWIRKICQAAPRAIAYSVIRMKQLTLLIALFALAACETTGVHNSLQATETNMESNMEMGAFSISLAVKDLKTSHEFYQKLGFTDFSGDPSTGWVILRNGNSTIGLFQGMFEGNIMTFNPGWSQDAEALGEFTDIRQLQQQLKAAGVRLNVEADESSSGPASIMLQDPDGNMILIDQHV
jgi:catechol 2,3-dioxygenase-like lactoylglutathione lyase family enzyme